TRQRRCGLPEPDVAEADADERVESLDDRGMMNEKRARVFDREIEHLVDTVVAQLDRENMALEAAAVARVALHLEIRHEMHFDRDGARAAAFLASPARDVERKMPRIHAEPPRLGTCGEQLADVVVDFQVRRGIRAHRSEEHTSEL